MTPPYAGLLVDIDGTLVDSNDAHALAWVDAFASHGRNVPFERVRPLIGMGGDKLLAEVASLSESSAEGSAISDARKRIFKSEYMARLKPTRGGKRFTQWLIDAPFTVVIATSARKDEVRDLLSVCGGEAFLDSATTSDDADHSKPDPDIVVAALHKAQVPADRVLMIGDTPYDIEAATRAGVGTVAFRCGGWSDEDLRGALAIYDDPADLLDHLDHSPLDAPPR
jgi:phosphoglycolate phosphatase-like HAD superfamily hydrolase